MSTSKAECLKLLKQLDTNNPGKIDAHVAESETAAVAPTTHQSNQHVLWLYGKCEVLKVTMITDLLPLAISLKILQTLNNIKAKISGSADEDDDTDPESEYASYFCEAFCPGLSTNKGRDIPYIYVGNTQKRANP
jgi:hypothetical protein